MLDMCVWGLSFEDQMEILKNITINANFCQDYEVNLPQFANFAQPQTIEGSQKLYRYANLLSLSNKIESNFLKYNELNYMQVGEINQVD